MDALKAMQDQQDHKGETPLSHLQSEAALFRCAEFHAADLAINGVCGSMAGGSAGLPGLGRREHGLLATPRQAVHHASCAALSAALGPLHESRHGRAHSQACTHVPPSTQQECKATWGVTAAKRGSGSPSLGNTSWLVWRIWSTQPGVWL